MNLFKRWLRFQLNRGAVTVTFQKKDGSTRKMLCTTSKHLVPARSTETDEQPARSRKTNDAVCPVYDLEANAWKCFRWDSIKQVTVPFR